MLQAVHMVRSMYPSRILYDDIYASYHSRLLEHMSLLSPSDFTRAICAAFDVSPADYALGKTRDHRS